MFTMMKTRVRKRRYLLQYAITFSLALFLPALLFFNTIVDSSYRKVISNNRKSSIDIVNTFSAHFESELENMRLKSLSFAIESRKAEANSILNEKFITSNSFNHVYVVDYLKQLETNISGIKDILLFYKNLDYVYTAKYKYTTTDFIQNRTGKNAVLAEIMKKYFNFDMNAQMVILSTFNYTDYKNAELYIGFPVKLSNDYVDAMIIYNMSSTSINSKTFSTEYGDVLDLYVFDENQCIVYANADEKNIIPVELAACFTSNENHSIFKNSDGEYAVFRTLNPITKWTYISVAPLSMIENDTTVFYETTKSYTIGIILLLLILLFVTIYINYSPINRLVKRVSINGEDVNEFRMIEQKINLMESQIVKKDILIMESLFNNILYGVSISSETKNILGLSKNTSFCVMSIDKIKLDNTMREQLTAYIKQACKTKIFITDMLYENHTIIICLIDETPPDSVASQILNKLRHMRFKNSEVFVGSEVSSINDIRLSYDFALKKLNDSNALSQDRKKNDKSVLDSKNDLKKNIMDYIEENFTDPNISLTIVADKFDMSIYSLSRFFKERLGLGFSEYITAKRIEYAKRLLITTDLKISDVGQKSGIQNARYFSKVFNLYSGMSPNVFRTKMRNS